MEASVEEVFEEDSMVNVTKEEEGVSSHVEHVSIVDLQNITNVSALTYCSAHGVERSI
ncbi:hypothetical protein KI387_029793, partial [Taxus chinensis]